MTDLDAIRAAAHRYSRGLDRLDLDLMQSAYWPDGTDDHGTFIGNAHAFCARTVTSHARFASTMHCILNHHVELGADGMTAHGEVYSIVHLQGRDEAGEPVLDTWGGRYLDTYEQRGGEWRILHRICIHEWDKREALDRPMPVDATLFRQGSEDRGNRQPLGRLAPRPVPPGPQA